MDSTPKRKPVFLPPELHAELRGRAYRNQTTIISELLKLVADGHQYRAIHAQIDADFAHDQE